MGVGQLYYEDRYLRECEATVVERDGLRFRLDRTVFYPEGGGQPGDRGSFAGIAVLDTRKEGKDIWHIAESEVPDSGKLVLDWEHRYRYMREHSAQHLLSALLYNHEGIGTVAVHQGEIVTIETDQSDILDETLLRIEDLANAAIRRGLRIWQDEVDHQEAESLNMRRSIKVEGRVMLVHIEDTDVVACGGLHVSNTSEIMEICFIGKERIRGRVRTLWKCGEDAVALRRFNQALVSRLSALLSADPGNIEAECRRMGDEITELRRKLRKAERDAARLILREGHVCIPSDIPVSSFDEAVKDYPDMALIADNTGRFLFRGSKEIFDKLKAGLDMKGGGRDMLFMGSYSGDRDGFLKGAKEILGERGSKED